MNINNDAYRELLLQRIRAQQNAKPYQQVAGIIPNQFGPKQIRQPEIIQVLTGIAGSIIRSNRQGQTEVRNYRGGWLAMFPRDVSGETF